MHRSINVHFISNHDTINGPDHWKTEQNGGHFVNHWKTEQTTTIGSQNAFGIPAPTVVLIA